MKVAHSLSVITLAIAMFALGCDQSKPASSDDAAGGKAGTSSGSASGEHAKAAAPKPIVIPEGKSITVRLNEGLSSNHSQAGQGFTATVAEPVTVDGVTVIEQGAAAHGTVVDAKGMGHFKGGALLHVKLDSVTIKGKEHAVETSATGGSIKGKGKR